MAQILKNIPDKDLVNEITKLAPSKEILKSFVLVYKGHKPNVALFIKSGRCLIGSEEILIVEEAGGRFLAFDELINGRACSLDVQVLEGSVVSIVDREIAHDILNFISAKELRGKN